MTRRPGPSRLPIGLLFAVAIAVAACGSGASATGGPGNAEGCDKWCGNGSATVTFAGQTDKITGGGCYDTGAAGIDARFGDWQGLSGGDYLSLTVYRPGAFVPTPLATAPSPNAPADTGPAAPTADGNVAGQTFILAPGAVIAITPDGTGSFSGIDVNGGGPASGYFTCH